MESPRSSSAERVVAIALMIWALAWIAYYRKVDSDDWIVLGVTLLLGLVGMAASLAVWRAKPGALRLYVTWAIVDLMWHFRVRHFVATYRQSRAR